MELELLNNIGLNRNQLLTDLMLNITRLGGGLITLIVLFILLVFFIYKKRLNAAILISASLAFSQIIAHILKIIIQRPRPAQELAIIDEIGFAMPSAHASLAAAFYGMILIQLLKVTKNKTIRFLLIFTIIVIIIL